MSGVNSVAHTCTKISEARQKCTHIHMCSQTYECTLILNPFIPILRVWMQTKQVFCKFSSFLAFTTVTAFFNKYKIHLLFKSAGQTERRVYNLMWQRRASEFKEELSFTGLRFCSAPLQNHCWVWSGVDSDVKVYRNESTVRILAVWYSSWFSLSLATVYS